MKRLKAKKQFAQKLIKNFFFIKKTKENTPTKNNAPNKDVDEYKNYYQLATRW